MPPLVINKYSSPTIKLMQWILSNKGDCTDRIDLNSLVREYKFRGGVRKGRLVAGIGQKLRFVHGVEEFEDNDKVKLLYMFSQPVNETFERILLDDGATLRLFNNRTISYFLSADGTVERGVAPQPDGEDEPMDDVEMPANDDMNDAPNVMDQEQEEVEQPAPVAAEPVDPKIEGAEPPAAQEPNDAHQEGAHQVPAEQVLAQGFLEPKLEPVEDSPLTISATDILKKLENLSSSFAWAQEIMKKVQSEIGGRGDQSISRKKVLNVIKYTHEKLMEGSSVNVPASKESMKLANFLRIYRCWLVSTEYNSLPNIEERMNKEMKAYDERKEGGPVKRIHITTLLHVLDAWLLVATPPI